MANRKKYGDNEGRRREHTRICSDCLEFLEMEWNARGKCTKADCSNCGDRLKGDHDNSKMDHSGVGV